jgi:hypothetical protein
VISRRRDIWKLQFCLNIRNLRTLHRLVFPNPSTTKPQVCEKHGPPDTYHCQLGETTCISYLPTQVRLSPLTVNEAHMNSFQQMSGSWKKSDKKRLLREEPQEWFLARRMIRMVFLKNNKKEWFMRAKIIGMSFKIKRNVSWEKNKWNGSWRMNEDNGSSEKNKTNDPWEKN